MTVTGCDDCPLMRALTSFGDPECECQHPGATGNTDVSRFVPDSWRGGESRGAPDWCPLRAGDLLVHLEAKPCK